MNASATIRISVVDVDDDPITLACLDPRPGVRLVEDGGGREVVPIGVDSVFGDFEPILAYYSDRVPVLVVGVDVESLSRLLVDKLTGAILCRRAWLPSLHGLIVAFEVRAIALVVSATWRFEDEIRVFRHGRHHKGRPEVLGRHRNTHGGLSMIRSLEWR